MSYSDRDGVIWFDGKLVPWRDAKVHVLTHSLERGNILSAGAEVVFPSGDEDDGLGKGTTVFEPYLAAAQIFAEDGFLHVQLLIL